MGEQSPEHKTDRDIMPEAPVQVTSSARWADIEESADSAGDDAVDHSLCKTGRKKRMSKSAKKAAKREHEAQEQAYIVQLRQQSADLRSCNEGLKRINRRSAETSDRAVSAELVRQKHALIESFGLPADSVSE